MAEYFKITTPATENRDEENEVVEQEDGSAIIKLDDHRPPSESKFYANLAEELSEKELDTIGRELCDQIERDKEARAKRDEQYAEGLRRTGLGSESPGGAEFMGASKVVHPMLTEACVDFSSRVMKEIFPPNGPAKAFVVGDPTDVDIERGNRLADFLNFQLTSQISEARSEIEQMCTQLPLGGGQYIKFSWDAQKKRPAMCFVPIEEIYIPYAASNFYTAQRKTHVQYLTELEFEKRVDSEMYRDLELMRTLMPELSKSAMASDKIEGREATDLNQDGLRTIYECFCLYEVEEKKGAAPYIITIDKESSKVLSIYRNWDEEDKQKNELDWIVAFIFLPWRGAYPIGLTHMIGDLAAATTGALRALLDSALINNFPGLLKLKGGTSGGQTERIDPTQVLEVEGSMADDDVRKLVMPMPFNPPSAVLFQLLGFLVDAGKQLIRTNMEEMSDSSANVPVGTTMARLEQGMTVFSGIHARMHHAMGKLLKVLYRVNKDNLTEKEVFNESGKLLVKREDFQGPMTIIPVSDPNIFSESQRFAQIQLIAQRAQTLPQLYDLRKVEELILERMKIPNVKDLLLPKQEGVETNAVNENIAATMGRPLIAFPEQDHISHLQVHLEFMTNKALGQSPLIAPVALPGLIQHLSQHITLFYANRIFDVASEAAKVDISELQKKSSVRERKKFDQMLAEASGGIMEEAEKMFAQIPQVVQQCQELLQKMQPPQPDPASQLAMAQIASQEKIESGKMQLEQSKMAQNMQVEQLKSQHVKEIEQLRNQIKENELQIKAQLESTKLQNAREIADAKLAEQSSQADQVMDLERMKQQAENLRHAATLDTDLTLEELKMGNAQSLAQTRHEQDMLAASSAHDRDLDKTNMAAELAAQVRAEQAAQAEKLAAQDAIEGLKKGGKVDKKPKR